MNEYYEYLHLEPHATRAEITSRYQSWLDSVPVKERSHLTQRAAQEGFQSLLGEKTDEEQLNFLHRYLKSIPQAVCLYLQYDNDRLSDSQANIRNSNQTVCMLQSNYAQYDQVFYAPSEIVKLCVQIYKLLDELTCNLPEKKGLFVTHPDTMLPCMNKILSVLQTVYQFDHYADDTVSGYNYEKLVIRRELDSGKVQPGHIHDMFSMLRPAILGQNERLLKRNVPKTQPHYVFPDETSSDQFCKSLLVLEKMKDIESFIQEHINRMTPRGKPDVVNQSSRKINKLPKKSFNVKGKVGPRTPEGSEKNKFRLFNQSSKNTISNESKDYRNSPSDKIDYNPMGREPSYPHGLG